MCANLTEIGRFARLDTWQFRMLKACTPGPYTFLLHATRETPRRLQHEKRRTIGVRVPDHPVPRMLLTNWRAADELDADAARDEPQPLTDGSEIQTAARA